MCTAGRRLLQGHAHDAQAAAQAVPKAGSSTRWNLQVCDFWAFATGNVGKDGLLKSFMSMHHSRDHMRKHIPAPGDKFVTSQSKPIMTFLEDTGPGAHDTTVSLWFTTFDA